MLINNVKTLNEGHDKRDLFLPTLTSISVETLEHIVEIIYTADEWFLSPKNQAKRKRNWHLFSARNYTYFDP